MARRRIFWHVGADEAGTAWLGHALDDAREQLAEAGVLVAGTVAERERVTAELRGNHRQVGLSRREVEGTSAQLVRDLWRHRGTTVLSLPGLAAASREQVALAMDGTRGAQHHLVLVQRDLTSQLYAGARAALEQGEPVRPEHFLERAVDGEGDEAVRAHRAGTDLPAIVRRWSRTVLPENVHVIGESSPELIWKRLGGLLGADLPLPHDVGEADLGPAQLAVLREVVIALEGRLDARSLRTTLRDRLSRDLLARQPTGVFPCLDHELGTDLRSQAQAWTYHLTQEGYDVQGTLRVEREDGVRRPISSRESASAALAETLVEVARLRERNEELERRNKHLDKKRRKHKSRVRELTERA